MGEGEIGERGGRKDGNRFHRGGRERERGAPGIKTLVFAHGPNI